MGVALPSSAGERLANYRQSGVRGLAVQRPLLALAFILAAALVLRVLFIDSRGLWSDEAYRVLAARQDTVFDTLRAAWAQPPSAPLYWVTLHIWVMFFGHSDVAVRLFSVPASVGTLVVAYKLGRLAGGTLVALLTACLLAISPFAIETGQESTMYAWSALFATCALWAGISLLRPSGLKTGRGLAAYVAFATLLLYTHYMGLLLVFELLVAGLFWLARTGSWRPRRTIVRGPEGTPLIGGHPANSGETQISPGNWVKAHLFVALLYSPWAIATGIRLAERADELSHLQHRAGLAELYGSFATMSVAPSAIASWPPAQVAVAVTMGGCLVLLALLLPRPREERHIIRLLAAISLGFVLIIVGTSAVTGAWLVQPRFVTLVLPAALVVIASALPLPKIADGPFASLRAGSEPARKVMSLREGRRTEMDGDGRRWGLPLTLLACLLIAAWLFFQVDGVRAFYTNPVHGRDGVREAAAWLNADRRPGDLAVANNGVLAWSLVQYHDDPIQGLPENADVRNGYQLWPTPDLIDLAPAQWNALTRLAPDAQRIWLVYLPVMDPHNEFMQSMRQRYRLVEQRHYGFADIYLFTK
jgi:hypothetical protein